MFYHIHREVAYDGPHYEHISIDRAEKFPYFKTAESIGRTYSEYINYNVTCQLTNGEFDQKFDNFNETREGSQAPLGSL